jgi:hypothetical protein
MQLLVGCVGMMRPNRVRRAGAKKKEGVTRGRNRTVVYSSMFDGTILIRLAAAPSTAPELQPPTHTRHGI